jgi:hypothetical protein
MSFGGVEIKPSPNNILYYRSSVALEPRLPYAPGPLTQDLWLRPYFSASGPQDWISHYTPILLLLVPLLQISDYAPI